MDTNSAGGREAGATDEMIATLPQYEDSDLFSDAYKAAFRIADAATKLPAVISDELFADAQRYFDVPALVEMAAIIAYENFRSRFNRIFLVEANGVYCPLPAARKA